MQSTCCHMLKSNTTGPQRITSARHSTATSWSICNSCAAGTHPTQVHGSREQRSENNDVAGFHISTDNATYYPPLHVQIPLKSGLLLSCKSACCAAASAHRRSLSESLPDVHKQPRTHAGVILLSYRSFFLLDKNPAKAATFAEQFHRAATFQLRWRKSVQRFRTLSLG